MRPPIAVILLAASLCALTPDKALAETPMTGAEFDANTVGEIITYDYGGGLFGTEEYLDGRRVRWAFDGDLCIYGVWYEKGDQICFEYENDPTTPACWLYFLDGGQIRGRYMGDGGGWEILESSRDGGPLPCAGPDLGA